MPGSSYFREACLAEVPVEVATGRKPASVEKRGLRGFSRGGRRGKAEVDVGGEFEGRAEGGLGRSLEGEYER